MTATTLAYASARTAEQDDSVRTPPRAACPAGACSRSRTQEADRAFDAGVEWFLAVSRAA